MASLSNRKPNADELRDGVKWSACSEKGLKLCPFRPVSFVDPLKDRSGDFRITDRILHHEHQNRKTN